MYPDIEVGEKETVKTNNREEGQDQRRKAEKEYLIEQKEINEQITKQTTQIKSLAY